MSCTRKLIVEYAKIYIGCKEGTIAHKGMIDTYNNHTPLPRGYKLKYTDSWCCAFISYLAIESGATDIIPVECSCQKFIDLARIKGIWKEQDSYIPKMGDIVLYDWNDNGKGDNIGWADHIGIVEKVDNNTLTIIEGNYSNQVKRRTIEVNARYIRGYAVPLYKEETHSKEVKDLTVPVKILKKGDSNNYVIALQALLIARGYSCGKAGIDGDFGSATETAVCNCQSKNGLTIDGIAGKETWSFLIAGDK